MPRNGKHSVKAKRKRALPPRAAEVETSFYRCPGGHQLPNHTNKGECSAVHCPLNGAAGTEKALAKRAKTKDEDSSGAKQEATVKLHRAQLRLDAVIEHFKAPTDLKGSAAEKFFDEEVTNLLPFAAVVLKKNLLLGDEDQQMQAADRVMNATGRGKKEAAGAQGNSITIVMPGADGGVHKPWKNPAVVNGEVIAAPALPGKGPK